jgi:hypothetical protein
MFWELYQQGRINQARQDASEARASVRSTGRDLQDLQGTVCLLEQQVERLTLAAMAMAEILRDRQGISEEEIEAKVREIDLRDGRLDGKLSPSVKRCGSCGRVNGPRQVACIYCGTDLPGESFLFGPERPA